MLLRIFRSAARRIPGVEVTGSVALIAGDRQRDGVFPLWSISENISIRAIASLRRGLLVSDKIRERTRRPMARKDRHPYAGYEGQHPDALRAATSRRPCSRAHSPRTPRSSSWTTRCAASTSPPNWRSMISFAKRPREGALSSGTRPNSKNWTIAIMSTSSEAEPSSPMLARGELTEEKVIQSSFAEPVQP